MSLQVWLPLNGNFKNQGTYGDINFTATGTISDVDGKIGTCKSFSSSNVIAPYTYTLGNSFSICLWVNWTTFPASDSNDWIIHLGKTSGYANAVVGLSCYHSTLITVMAGGKNDSTYTHGFTTGTWHHLAFTWRSSGSSYLYVDGELVKTYTNLTGGTVTAADKISLGSNVANSATKLQGKLNDVRFYDHFLSAEEIKEIARGKVLHYTLNRRPDGPGNLIMNGFGELGTTNWNTASKVFTDDLPTADTTIKARFVSNINTTEFIPLHRDQTYEISLYVKASSTSGSCYPSIIPYDIDKNRIEWRHCAAGFRAGSMTTLKQQLKAGDTKIYVNSLSGWTDAANWYNYAAIFGYKDSTGYTYPDGLYTRNIPAFWSGNTEAKTTLDKTNNIITLSEAYTGETIPVGRSICQSSAGSVYFYPFGAVANSGIADWTLKTTTFSSEHKYLSAARYMRFCMYSSSMCAGVKLTNQGRESTVYDISGLNNNGQMVSTLSYTTNSPRYQTSTIFNGVNSAIAAGRGGMVRDAITISLWGYMTDWSTYAQRMISCTEGGGWNFEPGSSKMRFACGTGATSNTYKTITSTKTLASLSSGWHMFTGTYDGFQQKIYIDGVLEGTNNAYTEKTPLYYYSSNGVFVGAEAGSSSTTPASGYYFNGYISDVRIYATALSAQDIQDLYNGLF